MSHERIPSQVWSELNSRRSSMMARLERYANLTHPKLLYPEGVNQENAEHSRGYGSLAGSAVNTLTNKLVMAMFSPVTPFFQLDPTPEALLELAENGFEQEMASVLMSETERQGARYFGSTGQRAKMYKVAQHLIVLGNACIIEESKSRLRVLGLRNWAVERDYTGEVNRAVIVEPFLFRNLQPQVQAALPKNHNPDSKVFQYRLIRRVGSGFSEIRSVNEFRLPGEFEGWYEDTESLPYHFPMWDLQDGDHYGTGLVEEFAGDFEAMELMDEGIVNGGTMAAEFRWGIDPSTGFTVQDFNNTSNGEAIPASKNAAFTISADVAVSHALKVLSEVQQKRERRVGQAFLMGSAVVRDGERVTAEEIRMLRSELESVHSGTFSNAATALQRPMARWCLKGLGVDPKRMGLEMSIPSGLEGLARSYEVDNFNVALSDLARIQSLPEEYRAVLRPRDVASFVGSGRGVRLERFMMSAEEQQQQAAETGARVGTAQSAAAANGPPEV